MVALKVILLITLVAGALAAGPGMARYDSFKVYKIFIKDEQQLSQLKKFRDILPVRLNQTKNILYIQGTSNDMFAYRFVISMKSLRHKTTTMSLWIQLTNRNSKINCNTLKWSIE